MTSAQTADRRETTLRVIAWLVERHHQSLGLWPWTWEGPEGEPLVTLYAACAALRFGDDFGALAGWIEASRWPPLDGTPYPATFYRHCLGQPDWALAAPAPANAPPPARAAPDLDALARAGAPRETLAQLLEAASNLDTYLAMLAPQRHGSHAHRGPAGRRAALAMRLATELALALGEDYRIPWTGPAGGRANGLSDPDWRAFADRYRLSDLPFPRAAHEVFSFGDRGWLHAAGWAGNRDGALLRLPPDLDRPDAFARARSALLILLSGA
jgi:hypothetical protein